MSLAVLFFPFEETEKPSHEKIFSSYIVLNDVYYLKNNSLIALFSIRKKTRTSVIYHN
ncbi:hypothetical protein M2135_002104 [Parabacteroides sp. PF5-9]|nr:hypothetical protein [Parabacteroides sp. PF5-9]